MPSKIILKKSSVTSRVPVAGDLEYGELALNYADGKLYYKKADTTIDFFVAGVPSGSGGSTLTTDTTPPASPNAGDHWLDTNSGIKYTYVDDGTSSQWVQLESALSISQSSGGGTSIYSGEYVLSGTTTNSTETEIFVGGVSNSRIVVPTDKTVSYTADIVCRRTDSSGDHAAFSIRGVATNTAGTVTDVGSLYEILVARTDAAFAVDIRADDTNNSINIYVTGNTGKTVSWKCAITVLEV